MTINNKYYKFFLIAFLTALALPLFTEPTWFHPAPWGKAIVFRIIISISLFVLVWQIIYQKIDLSNLKSLLDKKSRFFWPFWLLIALWAVFLLATIFSLDPYYSFWESPYRAGGFLNFSLYIIFAILAFLIIKRKDWSKIWNFSFLIGALASTIAILQYFEIFKKYLIPSTGRPSGTFGNSIFLAIYLLLLMFLALSFGLKEKKLSKKILYFSLILLFIFVILIIKARAVYLGLLIGSFYFFLFYSAKTHYKKILCLKAIIGIILISIALGVYFVNTQKQLPEFVENNRILKQIAPRVSFELLFKEARFPSWKIALGAVKEKPLLGWGLENFSIAFDKYYTPHPELSRTWWDRAHNFMLEIAVGAGIPALIIYLSLFGALFYQLQKLKKKNPNNKTIYHGIQATFIAYLTADFFSFDSFSTYLILFLLIGYCLSLLKDDPLQVPDHSMHGLSFSASQRRSLLTLGLFGLLIVFIWFGALRLLKINKEINWANYYSEIGGCEKALETMENILPSRSNVDSYLRIQYINIIRVCIKENKERKYILAPKAISILKELKEIRPNYTRTWIYLGTYSNILLENKENFGIENENELLKEADSYFQKASQLSPNREEMLMGWIETDILSGKYQEAKIKAEQCINLNPILNECRWKKAIIHIYLGELDQADQIMDLAIKQGHILNTRESLVQLQKAYIGALETTADKIKYYQRLADIYERSIAIIDPENFQYHASLAYVYKELKEYRLARGEAILTVKYSPESKDNVANFLDSIFMEDNNYFEHYFAGAYFYHYLGNKEKALLQTKFAQKYAPKDTNLKILNKSIYDLTELLREELNK